jgi:hypothetical protein
MHPVLGNQVLQFIEYLDGTKEERTGVSRLNQGIDANTLNKTASGQQALQAAANQRIELIARVFAETGVKEHFRNLHMLVLQHREQPDVVELLGKWVNIDPRTVAHRRRRTRLSGHLSPKSFQRLCFLSRKRVLPPPALLHRFYPRLP